MGIRLTTPRKSIVRYFALATNILDTEINRTLSYLGEEMLIKIRNRPQADSWIDHTGNLRSSIGYAIYNQGMEKMKSAFQIILQGSEGASVGEKRLKELSRTYANTYALVTIAGMDYASYVEAHDNKDVLASTNLWADKVLESYMNRALQRAGQKINAISL